MSPIAARQPHTMSTTKTNIQNEDQLKDDLTIFVKIVDDLKQKADNSSMLYALGVKDGFAQELEEFRQEPLKAFFSIITESERQISNFLKSIVIDYLKIAKKLIKKAYISSKSNTVIQFSLVLKEDNEEIRDIFYNFLEVYNDMSFSERFKVIFHFVSEELEENINKIEEIDL